MRMNGLLLDDPAVIEAMEPARPDCSSLRRRTPKGVRSIFQLGDAGAVWPDQAEDRKLLTQMAATLRKGDIAAVPAAGEADACAYCDYRAVCGREQEDPVRYIASRDRAELLHEWEEKQDRP